MSKQGPSTPPMLATTADLDAALAAPGPFLLFKHSTTCPISAAAYDEYLAFRERDPALRTAVVRVIEERPVSNHATAVLGIRHESPQALLTVNGAVVWNASHRAITADALARAATAARGKG